MKKIVVLTVVLVVVGVFLNACAPAGSSTVSPSAPDTGIQTGNQALDFNFELDGRAGSLSGLKGKPVMLNFWATWCNPCRMEIPFLQEVHKEQSGKGLVMLAVNVGESKETVNAYIQSSKMSLPVVLDSRSEIARKYRVNAFPTTYFIDKSGIIRSVKIGAFPSKAEIEKNLKLIMP